MPIYLYFDGVHAVCYCTRVGPILAFDLLFFSFELQAQRVVAALSPKLPPGKPIPMQTLHTVQARSFLVFHHLRS